MQQQAKYLFRTLYLFVHNAFTVFEIVLRITLYVWNYYNTLLYQTYHLEHIAQHVKSVKKLPNHLTILLGEEPPSFDDLTKLILWSIASDIPFISFYDYKGTLNESLDKFKQIVAQSTLDRVIWHDSETSYKNGFVGRKIHVKILGESDGRQAIVEAAKQLTESKKSQIDCATVDSYLKKSYAFPDPDLALYCGRTFNLFGYPPWQIRTTEFLSLHSHHKLTPQTFMKALVCYSKTEQRLGK